MMFDFLKQLEKFKRSSPGRRFGRPVRFRKRSWNELKIKTGICSLLMIFILVAVLLSACDSGLKYVKMEMETFPEKLVYYAGEDTFLQFDGGVVKLTTADSSESLEDLRSYAFRWEGTAGSEDCYISSDVNFSIPGEYTVTVHQTKDLSCQYGIEVRSGK